MTTSDSGARVREVAEDYWQGTLRRNPTLATFYGDWRYNDRLGDPGPAGRADEESASAAVLLALGTIPPESLTADDQVTWDMLRLSVETALHALRLRLDEMAVDQMSGPQVWLAELLNWHPTDTPEHVEQLIERFRAFPTYLEGYLENLADGVRDGRTASRIAAERVIGQLRSLLATPPESSPFAAPLNSGVSGAQADRLMAVIREGVYPSFQCMLSFLDTDGYLARDARADPGVWAVSDGEEIYGLLAAQHTTTLLTPRELHQIGLDDLASIQGEMRAIMQRLGDSSGDFRAFTQRLISAPENLSTSREEIILASERLLERATDALPAAFGRLPKTPCTVRAIEDYRERDSVAAFYYQPSGDGSRPGIFYVNTFEPASRPKHTLPALAFHEGVPGHHLQIALAQENANLPAFRRLGTGWLANAFVEGWALYTERLADELGLYPDDYARFGMLGYQAWRACRLVVDTGLHSLRWPRDRAIQFFYQNVGLTERETVNEVDRYIIWPGQALSYKIGQREIERLRREVQVHLGSRFSLLDFHDEVLRHGGLPLSTLRAVVHRAFRIMDE